jgi:hypothetical protein
MTYDVIALACEQLHYRDKLRLAQLLIQAARKEEEESKPEKRADEKQKTETTIEYIVERLLKLRPAKVKSMKNSISAMHQFQGGIDDADIEKIIAELQKRKVIKLDNNNVIYL